MIMEEMDHRRQKVDEKFKVPSLRNVALRFPTCTDGRFNRSAPCSDHYNGGIIITQPTPGHLLHKRMPLPGAKTDLVIFSTPAHRYQHDEKIRGSRAS